MTQSVTCEKFSYSQLECIIVCDASILSNNDIAGVGWVVLNSKTKIKLAEGRAITNSNTSTVEAELLAVMTALKEVQQMGYENVLIKTDYDGFVNHLNKNSHTNIDLFSNLEELLRNFNSWGFEKVERDKIDRPHNLASSIDLDINYSPSVN